MSSGSKFTVGQPVVCIKPDRRVGNAYSVQMGVRYPVVGRIYTVRKVMAQEGTVGIYLEEITNPVVRCGTPLTDRFCGYHEPGFAAINFAPVELLPDEALAELKECLEPAYA